jgi:hypothetical protein
LRLLLEFKANVTMKNEDGATAADVAKDALHPKSYRMLEDPDRAVENARSELEAQRIAAKAAAAKLHRQEAKEKRAREEGSRVRAEERAQLAADERRWRADELRERAEIELSPDLAAKLEPLAKYPM